MTDSNIVNFGDGPLTTQQRVALRRIRSDLLKMHLPMNGERHLATAIIGIVDCFLSGLDVEVNDEQDAQAKASV